LLESGIQPDILVLRADKNLTSDIRQKVALFCNVEMEAVIESVDVSTIYEVPLLMQKERLDEITIRKLNLQNTKIPDLGPWTEIVNRLKNPECAVKIGLVGKYVELADSYKSIMESLSHAGTIYRCKVEITSFHSEEITEDNIDEVLEEQHGIIVAPGFGDRGIEGKILAARYAREKEIPFLGICLGMQCAVIEFARNILGYKDAHSTEMDIGTRYPVIDLMEEQKGIKEKGGTMRLGAWDCTIKEGSMVHKAYNKTFIRERHRHRYEFNNNFLKAFEEAGFLATGINPESNLVEIMELTGHPFFIGVQFHPEYSSTVMKPHPLFIQFVKHAIDHSVEHVDTKEFLARK
jgi:CTP synthase